MKKRQRLAATVLLLIGNVAPSAVAAGPVPEAVLDRPAAASRWERDDLRSAVDLLAKLHQVSIFLDRRVNPDANVSGSFPPSSLGDLLEAIGRDHGGFGATEIGGVIYLGPRPMVHRLRTLDKLRRSEVRERGAPWARGLLVDDTLKWSDLTSPRELVDQVCREARVQLTNQEMVPHDLWAANRLTRVPRATQLTILLAGFDLTFDCRDDGKLTFRPIRGDELWEQVYPLPAGRQRLVESMRKELADAELTVEGSRLRVRGLVEDHGVVQQWLRHGRRPPQPADRQAEADPQRRFHMRVVRRPLSEVLREIERTTDYRFVPDQPAIEAAGLSLERLVTFEVQEVDVDGLLEAVEEQSGLAFRREGKRIDVVVRP